MKISFLQGIIDVVAKVIVDVIVDVIVHSGPEDGESDEAEEEEETEESEPNPLLADLGTTEAHLSKQASLWFKRVSLLNTCSCWCSPVCHWLLQSMPRSVIDWIDKQFLGCPHTITELDLAWDLDFMMFVRNCTVLLLFNHTK